MKKSDLYREWARVLDMCEGTNIKPWWCVRQPRTKELHRTDRMPDFTMRPDDYEFAVAILEDKQVFIGDKLYGKYSNTFYTVSKEMIDSGEHDYSNDNYWSWNSPKNTFNLNGEELPCPDGNKGGYQIGMFSERYYFTDFHDAQKVANAINKLLQDATK